MTNKFCHFLSNGYTLNVSDNQLTYRPCCVYTTRTMFSDTVSFQKRLEYNSSATSWIPECSECQRIESISGFDASMRAASKLRIVGECQPGDCVSLEVNFDKKCNAACLSCSSQFSSTWEKYNRKHNIGNQITSVEPEDLFHQFISSVSLDKLQFLYIQGGEPFYSSTNLNFLEHILKVHPDPGSVRLHYQTNGSLLPTQQIMDYWKKFKGVVMNYSIDDINDRFNYLRWPLDWITVKENIKTMIDTTNVYFRVNSTINPLNVLGYGNLESWILDNIPKGRLIGYRAGASVKTLDLRHTPTNLRNKVIETYGTNHPVSKLFNNNTEVFDHRPFIEYVEQHDALRRLDWKSTFPESVPFFKN